jgi:ribosomal-protein-alanine N-acetyltransferase
MHRIDAYIMPNNTDSLRLIERLSFHYEGFSQSFARINGIWTDHKHYALVNSSEDSMGK